MRKKVFFSFIFFTLFFYLPLRAAPPAWAVDLRSFAPRISGFDGALEVNTLSDSTKNQSNSTMVSRNDVVFQEKLDLSVYGYIYHPRFMTFLASVGVGLQQEQFHSSYSPQSFPWRNSTIRDYELRTVLLPEHPYNLELWSLRRSFFIREAFLQGSTAVQDEWGATFRYKKQPWSFNLGYVSDTLSSSNENSTTGSFNVGAAYSKGVFSNAISYNHRNTDISSNSAVNTVDYLYYSSVLKADPVLLQSTVNINDTTQRSQTTTPLELDMFRWSELLSVNLPWNFATSLSYDYNQDRNISGKGTPDEEKVLTITRNPSVELSHRLFESLSSLYRFSDITTTSSRGSTDTTTNLLQFAYTKKIPGGTMLALVRGTDSVTTSKGTPIVVNETHSAQLPPSINNFFVLNQQFVDQNSISIQVKNTSDQFVDLPSGYYTVTPFNNSFKIVINGLPVEVTNLRPPDFQYAFLVQYALLSNAKFDIKTMEYRLQLQLFDRIVNPYIDYMTSRETILAGNVLGGPQSSNTTTVGINLSKLPYSLLVEYANTDSTTNPMRNFRSEIQYQNYIVPTVNLTAKIYYMKDTYLPAPLVLAYTQTTVGGFFTLMKTFPAKNLYASLSGSYAVINSLLQTTSYSLNSSILWKIGKVTLDMGASITDSNSTSSLSKLKTSSEYYYLKFKRQLF